MKKIFGFLVAIIFIFILSPFKVVLAEEMSFSSKELGYIKDIKIDQLEVKKIRCTKYINLKGSGKPGLAFDAAVVNGYARNVDFNIKLVLYDKNDNVVDELTKEIELVSLSNGIYEEYVYSTDEYSVDRIAYYEMVIDVETNISVERSSKNYYIDEYYLKVDVNEDNTYKVNNTFRAIFKDKRTSVVNYGIPKRSQFVRFDGGRVNKRAVIYDISIPDYYDLKTEKGIRVLSIGKSDLANETKYYDVTYYYNVGKDTRKGNDEFVLYLINDFDVKVDGINFEINMPKDFKYEDIHFIDQDGIELESIACDKKDNTIKGKITGTIEPGSTYAIYVLLPEGYFKDTKSTISPYTIWSAFLSIAFLIFTIVLWYAYKKRNEKTEFNEFYFNKDLNSLEVGYLYNGSVKDNDIATLLFYLANKGYIKIKKEGKSYKIIKLKEYEENDRLEKNFMKELFYDDKEIYRKDLASNLGDLNKIITQKLNEDKRRKKVYLMPVLNYKLIFYMMAAVIFVVNTINIIVDYQPSVIWANVLFGGIGFILLFLGMYGTKKKIEKVLFTLVSLIFIVVPIVLTSYKAFVIDTFNLFIYVIGIICMILITIIVSLMSNRTRYGRTMYRKINGYKSFLVNVSEEEILSELKNNKNLFYDILPYTFVLGISDKWYAKFKDITDKAPSWFATDKFDLKSFNKDIKDIYSDVFIGLKSTKNEVK